MPDRESRNSREDLPAGDRLQPSLLDRLTDDEPDRRVEAPSEATMTRARLRNAVLRDLAWLLNATNLEAEIDFEGFPEARTSTINFGVRPLAGMKLSDVDFTDIDHTLREAILAFEPRLLPQTVEVRSIVESDVLNQHNTLAFEVRGKLWSIPYPLELLLRSSIDLESGEVVVKDESPHAP